MGNNFVFVVFFCLYTIAQASVTFGSSRSYGKKFFAISLVIRLGIFAYFALTRNLSVFYIVGDFLFTYVVFWFFGTKPNPNFGKANYDFPNLTYAATQAETQAEIPTMRCPRCNAAITSIDKFCGECGNSLTQTGEPATVDPLYLKSEKQILEDLIKECASKNNYNINATLPEMKKRKIVLTAICGIISLIFTSLYFFHITSAVIVFEIINLVVYLVVMNNFNTMKYLIKEVKSRPDEDLEYVVSNVLSNVSTFKYSRLIYASVMIISIIVPLIVFSKPHYFYEYTKDGYYIRFYTTSYKAEEHITIPETYKGKKVIGIRGNVFMNLKKLKSVTLPDTMEVIRGNAFYGDVALESINIPSKLTYLGGGAFKFCKKLKNITIPEGITEIHGDTFAYTAIESIEIPDTVTDIGGSAFQNCEKLKSVKLPKNITEIHGNTFENCISLESIDIPDGVTRIGGHAFYNNQKLSSVTFTENSRLVEIGSSAFRLCYNLGVIKLPASATNINERAFKDSPTTIYYIGEIMYGHMIDENAYEHKTFGYLKVGEGLTVGEYYEDAICHNDRLVLNNINVELGKVTYTVEYSSTKETKTVTLDSKVPYAYINDNIAIEISDKYAAESPRALSFNVYYN